MPSSPTTRLKLEKQGTGENLDTWGTKLNASMIDLVDEAIAGVEPVTVSGPVTLTATNYVSNQARHAVLVLSGTGGTVTVPSVEKVWLIRNAGSGNMVISAGGVTVTILPGNTEWVFTDGTDVFRSSARDQTGQSWSFSDPTTAQQPATKAYADTRDAATLTSAQAYADAQILAAAVDNVPPVASERGGVLGTTGATLEWFTPQPTAGNVTLAVFNEYDVDATGGSRVLTLPLNPTVGDWIVVRRVFEPSANTVTVGLGVGQTFVGTSDLTWTLSPGHALRFRARTTSSWEVTYA